MANERLRIGEPLQGCHRIVKWSTTRYLDRRQVLSLAIIQRLAMISQGARRVHSQPIIQSLK